MEGVKGTASASDIRATWAQRDCKEKKSENEGSKSVKFQANRNHGYNSKFEPLTKRKIKDVISPACGIQNLSRMETLLLKIKSSPKYPSWSHSLNVQPSTHPSSVAHTSQVKHFLFSFKPGKTKEQIETMLITKKKDTDQNSNNSHFIREREREMRRERDQELSLNANIMWSYPGELEQEQPRSYNFLCLLKGKKETR